MNRLALLLPLLAAAIATAQIHDPVRLDSGLISGTSGKSPDVRVYKGIPYAAPPVGDLRWRPPQPAAHWDGVRKADEFGSICMQVAFGGGRGRGGRGPAPGAAAPAAHMSEDCLYANVWTAAKSPSDRLPVIVWSHPGGFTSGSGSSPQFNGEALAKKGVVLVTYNYRLGVFGFFSYPELSKESGHHASGNQGLMDLVGVLRWVKKNIAAFGGDPTRVMIAGDSAGAALDGCLTGSPMGKGLFSRASSESGAWMGLRLAKMPTLQQAEAAGMKVADAVGAHSLAELRAVPAEKLLKEGRGSGTIVDGWYIPQDLSKTFAEDKQNHVNILVGSNRDEGTFFVRGGGNAEQFISQAKRRFGDMADEYLKLYPAGSDKQAHESQLASFRDELGAHMRLWAEFQSAHGKNKAYLYYFTHVPPSPPGRPSLGATHGAESAYVFDNPSPQWNAGDRRLAEIVSSYWVNFAANGDPNGKDLTEWPAFSKKSGEHRMVLGDTVEVEPKPDTAHIAFWQKYFEKLQSE
jgi:para-nitrobenzyl esterase